jgi:hypothetical protein
MRDLLKTSLPVPPALVYFLHQLREHGIAYRLYGEVPGTDMVFVDIDRDAIEGLQTDDVPSDWSLVSPHFIAQRALEKGEDDPITGENMPEAVVIAYGGKEAEQFEHFQSLCEQIRYLRHQSPSRLIYHSKQPPEPLQIQAIIELLKTTTRSRDT